MERLRDNGPVYYETDLDHLFVEPWNAISSLTFLIPVIFLLIRLKGQYHHYWFLIFVAAPLMAIGGLGSTLYHAFRAHPFFLYMDFVPIALMTLSISIYFWYKVLPNWFYILLVVAASFLLRFAAFGFVKGHTAINLSYFLTGVMIFLPALIFLFRTHFIEVKYLIYSILFLIIALFFRYADSWENHFFSFGTHWLWHIFTSTGALTLATYLIKIQDIKPDKIGQEIS